MMHGLRDLRVIDFSTGIAGPYASKLLADAGADVIKVESDAGDPLRTWSVAGGRKEGETGALFQFLNASKRSVLGGPEDPEMLELMAGADLVVENFPVGTMDRLKLRSRFPHLVWLSITPFGRGGPWSSRPASEFTVQAESGSIGVRGLPGEEPFQVGGRTTDWIGGTYAAVGALAAVLRAKRTGQGEHVDFSLLEVMNIAASNYMDLFWNLAGDPPATGLPQSVETPSVEPTEDGFVGFCTNTAQQFSDFLLLIERPDLRDDKQLFQVVGRMARFDEWCSIVKEYTRQHTTDEIIEKASLLRIPVAPVNDGKRVGEHEQLVERRVFFTHPGANFQRPRSPYRLNFELPAPPRPAPNLGEHTGQIEPASVAPRAEKDSGKSQLPLAGVRILDMTAWWAGPSASHVLACLGADVIHLESIQRPDGMRMAGGAFFDKPQWWERSAFFLAGNSNKRGITVDLTRPEGIAVVEKLVAGCDVLLENFTPRVMDNFGLEWEKLKTLNPQLIFVRMPAFGLDGPWRDNTGFAQTMEQLTGLAWVTGHSDDQPRIQRGPCDPLAGMHAAFTLLVALEERRVSGQGVHVESTMVEGALNAAAEQVIEYTAYGNLMQREGNRSPEASPQGLYPCDGHSPETPRWLALSVVTDAHWNALVDYLGRPDWSLDPELATREGRRAQADALDARLGPVFAEKDCGECVEKLVAAGIPAAGVADPRVSNQHVQLRARGFHEISEHPIAGSLRLPTLPFRYESVQRWIRHAAPTLGQHNHQVLQEFGISDDVIADLESKGIIGSEPEGL